MYNIKHSYVWFELHSSNISRNVKHAWLVWLSRLSISPCTKRSLLDSLSEHTPGSWAWSLGCEATFHIYVSLSFLTLSKISKITKRKECMKHKGL